MVSPVRRASSGSPFQGHCLPPDQRVLTPDGYRPISAVDVREPIVTGLGRVRLITAVTCREAAEPLYHLLTTRSHLLRATGEHPVLARRAESVPEWVAVRQLRHGDLVAIFGSTSLGWRPRFHREPPVSGGGVAVLHEDSALYVGMDWVPLASVEAAPYAGSVYDLDVEEDHSFVSEGLVLSACSG